MRYPCVSSPGGHNDRVSNQHPGPGDVDWLDLGPDPDEGKPPADPRRRYLWYGGAAALVVALLVARAQNGTNQAAAPAAAAATSHSSASVSASTAVPASSSPGAFANPTPAVTNLPSGVPMRVSSAGHRLLDVPADWELFARGEDSVIRVQLALGRVTVTAVPKSSSDIPVTFFVGADRAIVRPADATPPSVVRDGKPAAEMPALRDSFTLLPAPDSRHMWVQHDNGLALATLDGKPTGTTIDVPTTGSVVGSDGAGYALVSGMAGGVYYAKPGSLHRISTGTLVASGPTRWLTTECDDSLNCALVATDRASGAHHRVDAEVEPYLQNLTLSPDGRTLAIPRSGGGVGTDTMELVDLDSGLHRQLDVIPNGVDQPNGASYVWSPDSRWLFLVSSERQVVIVNRATGKAAPLGVRLPPVLQLALRHRTG